VNFLLDTASVVWISLSDERFSKAAREIYADRSNVGFISVISVWEIIIKNRLGKLALPAPIEELLRPIRDAGGIRLLPLNQSAVLQLDRLPNLHRDPFDRMLICQAIDEDLTIITPDKMIREYPVKSLW
jgi:PIN domain nuclease of toxin-antitoxin system